jgi:hypothetical protein
MLFGFDHHALFASTVFSLARFFPHKKIDKLKITQESCHTIEETVNLKSVITSASLFPLILSHGKNQSKKNSCLRKWPFRLASAQYKPAPIRTSRRAQET